MEAYINVLSRNSNNDRTLTRNGTIYHFYYVLTTHLKFTCKRCWVWKQKRYYAIVLTNRSEQTELVDLNQRNNLYNYSTKWQYNSVNRKREAMLIFDRNYSKMTPMINWQSNWTQRPKHQLFFSYYKRKRKIPFYFKMA